MKDFSVASCHPEMNNLNHFSTNLRLGSHHLEMEAMIHIIFSYSYVSQIPLITTKTLETRASSST